MLKGMCCCSYLLRRCPIKAMHDMGGRHNSLKSKPTELTND